MKTHSHRKSRDEVCKFQEDCRCEYCEDDLRRVEYRAVPLKDVDEEFKNFEANGKMEINMLLWKWLSPRTTIGEADRIACDLFDTIYNSWLPEKER